MKVVTLVVELTDAQAFALAQFLKRAGVMDYRPRAVDDEEAYMMADAGDEIRKALVEVGYAPR